MIAPIGARRARPNMPHYGITPDQLNSMLDWAWVERQMTSARNYWVATVRADGSPHSVPVWGIWFEGAFTFGTDPKSVKACNIQRDNRVVIHTESGDDALIFHGRLAEAQITAAMREPMTKAYIDKYNLDPQLGETASIVYRLLPRKVMAWLECDYPATATSWLFDV